MARRASPQRLARGGRVLAAEGHRRADLELHHAGGRGELDVVLRPEVAQQQGLAGQRGEVDDDLVALGHAASQQVGRLRDLHEPAVGADHGQRQPRGRALHRQREVVGARDRRVEDPEAVLARLDLHVRPRDAVDEDHVAVRARLVVVGEDELRAGVEHRVAQDDRHVVGVAVLIVRAPPQRQPRGALLVVVEQVQAGQAHVGVRRRVVDAVVVVPERAGVLGRRVPVVLVLAGGGRVARVAVVLRERRVPVQVHRGLRRAVAQHGVLPRDVVVVPDEHGTPALRVDRRARRRAAVAPDQRLREPREDRHLRLPHVELVVVDLRGDRVTPGRMRGVDPGARHGQRGPRRLGHLRDAEGQLPDRGEEARVEPVRLLQHAAGGPLERKYEGGAAQRAHLDHVSSCQSHGSVPGCRRPCRGLPMGCYAKPRRPPGRTVPGGRRGQLSRCAATSGHRVRPGRRGARAGGRAALHCHHLEPVRCRRHTRERCDVLPRGRRAAAPTLTAVVDVRRGPPAAAPAAPSPCSR